MRTAQIGELTGPVKTWNPSRTPEAEFDYIDLSAVDNIRKVITTTTRTIGADAPSRARQLVTAGDVLVSTVRPNLNAVAVVPPELDGATASTGFTVLRPAAQLNGRYLFHWLRSPTFVADMARKATGASYPAVSDRIIKESTLPAPSLDKQHRIAAILDHADTLRVERRRALAHLDALPQAIFHKTFGGEATTTTLGEVAEIQGGLQVSARRESLPLKAPYLRVANVHRGRLDLSEVKVIGCTQPEWDRTRLRRGDLLFVEGHANPLEVGRAAIWDDQVDGCIHQNHLIRARTEPSLLLPAFAAEWFSSARGAAHFRRAGKTTSGLNTISASTVRSAPLPLPPLDEQQRFARRVDVVSRHRARATNALRCDDELFASLQTRAFKGEL